MKHEQEYLRISKRTFTLFLGMCIGGLAMTAGVSFADNLRSTQTIVGSDLIVPYDGYLMIDSQPITGQRELKFELFESASGGTAEWTETQTVSLYNGRFSVGLGTSSSLTNTLLDAEKLWLAMTIIETNSGGSTVEVGLSGRQAIEPAPFAAWAASSADFDVAGALDVDGSANIGGALNVGGDFRLADDRDIYGADIIQGFNDLRLQTSPTSGNVLLLQDTLITAARTLRIEGGLNVLGGSTLGNGNDTVTINGVDNNGSTAALILEGPGNTDMFLDANEIDGRGGLFLQNNTNAGLTIGSNTTINGTTTANGSATIGGNLTVTGDITNLTVREFGATSTGSVNLAGTTNSICFLTQVKITDHNQDSDESDCAIEKSGSGTLWQLKRRTGAGANPTCKATCLTW